MAQFPVWTIVAVALAPEGRCARRPATPTGDSPTRRRGPSGEARKPARTSRRPRGVGVLLVSALALALAGCSMSAVEADDVVQLVDLGDSWGRPLPRTSTLESVATSEIGPHGEHDAVYVFTIPASDVEGAWERDRFTAPPTRTERDLMDSIMDASGAELDPEQLQALLCQDEVTSEDDPEDHLVVCLQPETRRYVAFERRV